MVTPIKKSHILLTLTYIYLTNILIDAESRQFISSTCYNVMSHNPESKYRANLNDALSSLLNTESGYGFYNSSVGDEIDTANAILLCRGDVDQSTCQSCLSDSIVELTQTCPNASKANILYDECFLRFSNETILGYTTYQYDFAMWSHNNKGNSSHFNQELRSLIERLIKEAASGGSLLKFATGNMSLSNSMKISRIVSLNTSEEDSRSIYGLVQCTPDLSGEQCKDCLEKSRGEIIRYTNGSMDARIVSPWCTIRYSNVLFYNNTRVIRTLSPAAALESSPSTSLASGMKLRSRWLI